MLIWKLASETVNSFIWTHLIWFRFHIPSWYSFAGCSSLSKDLKELGSHLRFGITRRDMCRSRVQKASLFLPLSSLCSPILSRMSQPVCHFKCEEVPYASSVHYWYSELCLLSILNAQKVTELDNGIHQFMVWDPRYKILNFILNILVLSSNGRRWCRTNWLSQGTLRSR